MKPIEIGKIEVTSITPLVQKDGSTRYELEYRTKPNPMGKAMAAPRTIWTSLWGFLEAKTIVAFILGMAVALVLSNT